MPPPPSPSPFPGAPLPQPRSPLSDLLGGTRKPAYVAFDLLWLDGADLRALPLSERRKRVLLYNGRIKVWVPLRGVWDPGPPVGGNPPAPRSRVRTRWDPEPALGLAIRPGRSGPRLRAGRSGGGLWRGRGSCLSRVRARDGSGQEGIGRW